MSDSPDIPRITPYQLIFGAEVFDRTRFEGVREQADAHGAISPAELFMLPAAGELLREMTPPEGGKEIVAQVRALLFSAYRHWRSGAHVYRLTESMLRHVIAADTKLEHPPRPPADGGYVQLPRNMMWAQVAEDAAPEPVDGFFWSAPAGADEAAARRLDLLFALGVRAGRPGLSLFGVELESATQLDDWATVSARPEGEDFANVLPGGELQGYHAITTGAEALKLSARCMSAIADPAVEWSTLDESGETIHVAADG